MSWPETPCERLADEIYRYFRGRNDLDSDDHDWLEAKIRQLLAAHLAHYENGLKERGFRIVAPEEN